MSYILGILIILIAMLVIGVKVEIITGIIMGGLMLINFLLLLFFTGCAVMLAGSKQKRAVFSRIEVRTGDDSENKGKFDRACYLIDGREFPNAFPCEIVLKDKLYIPDKSVTVWLCEKKGFVFDRNAFAAVITGFFFFAVICTVMGVMLMTG